MNSTTHLWIESRLWPRMGDIAWQGTALLAVVLAVVWGLRQRSSAARRHALLAAGMGGIVLVTALSGVMPTWTFRPSSEPRVMHAAAVVVARPDSSAGKMVPDETGIPLQVETEKELSSPQRQPATSFARETAFSLPVVLAWVWVLGMALGLLLLLFSMGRLRWLRARAVVAQQPALKNALERATRSAGLSLSAVTLYLGERGAMPMMWGWRRIVILLPQEAEHWSQERVDLVLRHELAHAARQDAAISLGCWLTVLPFWWHPLAWLALRILSRLREEACDDHVLRGMSGRQRVSYAEMLVKVIAGAVGAPRRAWLPALAMASAQARTLRARLEAIVDEARDRRPFSAGAQMGVVSAVALLAAGLSMLSACREAPASAGNGAASEDGSRIYFLTDHQWEVLTLPVEGAEPPPPEARNDPFAPNTRVTVLQRKAPDTAAHDLKKAALRIRTHLLGGGVKFTRAPDDDVVTLKDERTMRVWTDEAGHNRITQILVSGEKKPLIRIVCHALAVPIQSDWLKELTRLHEPSKPATPDVTGMLSTDQAESLINRIRVDKACSIFAAPTVLVPDGKRATIESVRELIYPTEFDGPQIPEKVTTNPDSPLTSFPVTPTTPTAFEMRPVGFRFEVDPKVDSYARTIELSLAPQWTVFEGFINYGQPIYASATDAFGKVVPVELTQNKLQQPVFRTSSLKTTVTIPDGGSVVLGGFGEPPGADVGSPHGSIKSAQTGPTLNSLSGPIVGTQGNEAGELSLEKLESISKVDRAIFFIFQAKLIDAAP